MGLYQRGGIWYIRFQFRGQKINQSTGLEATRANKPDAKRQETALRESLKGSVGIKRTRADFADAAFAFLSWNDATAEAESTAKRNRTSFVSLLQFFARYRVDEITPAAVEDYKQWRLTSGLKAVTVRHDLDALGKFFSRYAVPRGLASANPVQPGMRPSDKDSRSMYVLTDEDAAKYFAAAQRNQDLYDLASLMLLTGCRPEEALSAQKSSYDAKGPSWQIERGKTPAARRKLPLPADAAEIFDRRLAGPSPWFFAGRKPGQHLVKLNGAHDRACEESKVFFRLYDLRHTFATRAVESGVDVVTLAALLGHSRPSMVFHYAHPSADQMRRSVASMEIWRKKKV